MSKHVIKLEYEDGEKLETPVLWCGRKSTGYKFEFHDAQHVALAVGGSIAPCKSCIRAIIKELEKEQIKIFDEGKRPTTKHLQEFANLVLLKMDIDPEFKEHFKKVWVENTDLTPEQKKKFNEI